MLFPPGILSNAHLKNYPGAPAHFVNAATNVFVVAEVTPTDDMLMSPKLLQGCGYWQYWPRYRPRNVAIHDYELILDPKAAEICWRNRKGLQKEN